MHWILLVFFTALCSIGLGQKASEWKLKKEANGIQVFTREAENSSFSELRMKGTFETSMSAMIALFKDIPNYTSWVYSCTVSESVKKSTDGEDYYYSITSAPWPVSDRDVVVHSKVTQDSSTWIVTSTSENIDSLIPEKDGFERVPLLQSAWTLIPLEDGKVDITYDLSVDPGGLVPAWLANLTLTIGPYNTMVAIKKELAKNKYKNARFPYIHEPYLAVLEN
ncbi:MAG: START domain-containing protein [Flavobacteriales bacterium]|nr:START domain-containing protein [Flavobacteriales bacterium]